MNGPRGLRHPIVLLALALLVVPHLILRIGFTWTLATEVVIFVMVGLGYNLLMGYTGLLSFGHGMFFGLAAYGLALAQLHWFPSSSLWPLLVSMVWVIALGAAVGFLALRRRGVYFSLLTLAFTALTFYIVYRWTDFTGGENGLSGVQRHAMFGVSLQDPWLFYHVVAFIVLAVAALLWRLTHSPLGSVLVAIRENEQRARFMGYSVRHYKLIAFVISAAVTGLGGCLFALLKLFVSADLVHATFSGEILMMTLFGGMGNFLGPALGALVYLVFREAVSGITSAWQLWFGLLFMAFILYSPLGLVGLGERLLAPWRKTRVQAGAMAARATPATGAPVPDFLRAHPPLQGGVVSCDLVQKRFQDFVAVRDVNLHVEDRTLHALIGPNGAGKTTLFNIISGMYAPDHGAVRLAGTSVGGLPPEETARRGLARSFQIPSLFRALRVREHLRLAVQARSSRRFNAVIDTHALVQVEAQTDALIEYLGLRGMEDAAIGDLSHGGQRLVEVGVALAAQPRALLLDEPLAGLSESERNRVTQLIVDLKQYMAVLMVEHDVDRVFDIADQVTVMNEGQILVEGAPASVRAHPEVRRVYIGSGTHAPRQAQSRVKDDAPVILSVAGINTLYGKSHILHDVSFDLRRGEVLALLGRNGAGKSSTFKSILGWVPTQSGSVTFDGQIITGMPPERIARMGLAIVPQGRRLFAGLTVEENLKLGALAHPQPAGASWDMARIFACFPRLRERLQVKADQLSGGEQQMVAIARALRGHVKVLLLDEPFEGLSPVMVEEVYQAIEQLTQDLSILIVEHHLDTVLSLADRVVILDRGRVSHTGPAAPLLTDMPLRQHHLWS